MVRRHSVRIAIAGVVIAGLLVGWHYVPATRAADSPPAPPAVPVGITKAAVQDFPVYLDGLGTVQAFNVVQIKAQVNGNLIALPAREGEEVHKGDIVAEIDPRPYKAALDQAMAQRGEDMAQLRSAQLDLERYQTLAKHSFAPVQQVDDQQATVNKETSAVAVDDALIETAQINLGYCVIHAPIDGRVSLYQLDVGNLVQANGQTGIISITQDKPIAVVFTLPEADLARVQAARAKGAVPVLVTPADDQKAIATGTLLTPNNTIDTSTGTISMKAQFANDHDELWPGEFVNARVQVETLHNAVTIPVIAIQHGPNGEFVYVVKPDQTVEQVAVQVGYQDGGRAVISKGLAGDTTVVVTGQARLAPGTHVKPSDATKAAPAEASDGSSSAG